MASTNDNSGSSEPAKSTKNTRDVSAGTPEPIDVEMENASENEVKPTYSDVVAQRLEKALELSKLSLEKESKQPLLLEPNSPPSPPSPPPTPPPHGDEPSTSSQAMSLKKEDSTETEVKSKDGFKLVFCRKAKPEHAEKYAHMKKVKGEHSN